MTRRPNPHWCLAKGKVPPRWAASRAAGRYSAHVASGWPAHCFWRGGSARCWWCLKERESLLISEGNSHSWKQGFGSKMRPALGDEGRSRVHPQFYFSTPVRFIQMDSSLLGWIMHSRVEGTKRTALGKYCRETLAFNVLNNKNTKMLCPIQRWFLNFSRTFHVKENKQKRAVLKNLPLWCHQGQWCNNGRSPRWLTEAQPGVRSALWDYIIF